MAISEIESFSRRDVARRASESPEGRKKIEDMVERIKDLRRVIRENPEQAKNYRPPRELLEELYADLAKEYEEIPMTKEEIEREFSAENLAKISLNDYVKLLRRVPPRFVTHVTRQGVRDHVSHHDAGKGKYSGGFEKIVEAGKLQSVLEQHLQGTITRDIVKEVLSQHLRIPAEFASIKEARQEIDDFLNRSRATNLASSEIADRRALHVAMDYVADDYYGGERENEIFFVYPTAYVAAHNYLAPQTLPFSEELKLSDDEKRSQYNDFWIRSKKTGAGELPVDAAIVFIPERTPVDPETGSRYALDKDKNPIVNTEEIDRLKRVISSPELRALWPRMYEHVAGYRAALNEKRKSDALLAKSETKPGTYAWSLVQEKAHRVVKEFEERSKDIEPLIKICRDKGIKDPRFYEVFVSDDLEKWQALTSLFDRSERDEPFKTVYDDEMLAERTRSLGIHFKIAENTVPSRAYWEKHFKTTGKKPSKIVFYEQSIPSQALEAFKDRAGLKEQKDGADLREMFSENLVSNRDIHDYMQRERELFAQFAEEVLRDLYPE